jgi:hypothetical protein
MITPDLSDLCVEHAHIHFHCSWKEDKWEQLLTEAGRSLARRSGSTGLIEVRPRDPTTTPFRAVIEAWLEEKPREVIWDLWVDRSPSMSGGSSLRSSSSKLGSLEDLHVKMRRFWPSRLKVSASIQHRFPADRWGTAIGLPWKHTFVGFDEEEVGRASISGLAFKFDDSPQGLREASVGIEENHCSVSVRVALKDFSFGNTWMRGIFTRSYMFALTFVKERP